MCTNSRNSYQVTADPPGSTSARSNRTGPRASSAESPVAAVEFRGGRLGARSEPSPPSPPRRRAACGARSPRGARRSSSARGTRTRTSCSSARRRASTRIATGCPFAGRAGELLDAAPGRGRALARRHVPRDGAQVPAPRATAIRSRRRPSACEPYLYRQLELIQPDGRRDPRELRDGAALRPRARDHARPRPGAAGHARRAGRHALSALPPGRGALHADDARGARARRRPPARPPRRGRRVAERLVLEPVRVETLAGPPAGPARALLSAVAHARLETARRRRPRPSRRGSPARSHPATSSSSRASSAPGRRRSSAARAARSA